MVKQTLSVLVVMALLAGCGSVAEVRNEVDHSLPVAKRGFENSMRPVAPAPRVRDRSGTWLPVTRVSLSTQDHAWLRAIRTDFYNAPYPTPVSKFIASLAAKGLNVVSDLPLDTIMFTGSVTATDAESALRLVLGSSGLDYSVDDARRIVAIKPLPTKTWTLNINNRRSSFATSAQGQGQGPGSASSSPNAGGTGQQPGGAAQAGAGGTGGQSGAGQGASGAQPGQSGPSSASSSAGTSGAGGGNGIYGEDDFWGQLKDELTRRLRVAVPAPKSPSANGSATPAFPTAIPGMQFAPNVPLAPPQQSEPQAQKEAGELYVMKNMGTFTVNPVTGAVRVQAPHWFLEELDQYMRQIQELSDTVISFEGQLVLVTTQRRDTEGFDLQSFVQWANQRYGAVISNNPLGGVTVGFGNSGIPAVGAAAQTIAGPLIGITSAKDGLSLFNDYMRGLGNFSVKDRVSVATASGVPGSFSTLTPRNYQLVSQSAVAGSVGAAQQATTYTLLQKEFGTELRVNPRYDLATGRVRAQIDIRNVIYAGDQEFAQPFSLGQSVQVITQKIPLEKKLNYSGETVLNPGDLIILGGQSAESLQSDEAGLPIGSVPLGGFFGTKKATTTAGTYYFVLQVKVKRR